MCSWSKQVPWRLLVRWPSCLHFSLVNSTWTYVYTWFVISTCKVEVLPNSSLIHVQCTSSLLVCRVHDFTIAQIWWWLFIAVCLSTVPGASGVSPRSVTTLTGWKSVLSSDQKLHPSSSLSGGHVEVQSEVFVQTLVEFWLNYSRHESGRGSILAHSRVSSMLWAQCL